MFTKPSFLPQLLRVLPVPLVIWIAVTPAMAHDSVCTLASFPIVRDPSFTHFIATALPDTVRAAAGGGPTRYTFAFLSASTPPGLKPPPPRDAKAFGQLVRLDRVGGFGRDRIQGDSNAKGEAVLVPWGYQADCSPVLWDTSARWLTPGSVGFFMAQLRPDSEWIGGRPTFDIGAAWHQPYPHGEFLKRDRERGRSQAILSVSELWELYEALPTVDSLEANADRAIESVRRWARTHPDQARRWPASEILEFLESSARQENR